MNYCRFSSDNFKSDVYVYGGHKYIIHVAASKFAIPPIPALPLKHMVKALTYQQASETYWSTKLVRMYIKLHMCFNRLHSWSVRNFPTKAIGLPFDGAYFECEDAKACYNKLVELQTVGYHVPQYAMDALLQGSMEDMLERIEKCK